jgi:predicted NBD/HSP70 family sugar kinase
LGRGIAGLINGLDPDLVILGGLAHLIAESEPAALDDALRAGLMNFRASSPPPLRPAALGESGSLVGAAEQVWDQLWPQVHS